MKFRYLERLLSLGQSEELPGRLARHIRVTNALALLGGLLSLTGVPLDAREALSLGVIDLACVGAFGMCFWLNARHHHLAARIVLLLAANFVMLGGVLEIGNSPEIRSSFFPLVFVPFLVLDLSERIWLALFAALPIAAYFLTEQLGAPPDALNVDVYKIYAPVIAFVLIVSGSVVFARIDREVDDELLRTRARAIEQARLVALGELAGGVAHEIRNPLAAIHLAATQIADHPDDRAHVAELGARIQRIVMRASHIIDALRSFARDASGDPFVTAPVERIIGDSLELCGKRLTEHGVVLTVSPIPPDLALECRPVQLTQVLVNLLGNSYDSVASAADRWVRIEVKTDRERLELAVTDSGPGIPVAARPRIFEPFFTTKSPDRGTGLGLSLSRGLVEAHHGTLELDDSSPRTRFVMRLPLTQPRALGDA